MNVRKFYASSTREALRLVRDALGADAIILSNRQVANGIEIMAVADMDVVSLAAGKAEQPAPAISGRPPVQRIQQVQPVQPAEAGRSASQATEFRMEPVNGRSPSEEQCAAGQEVPVDGLTQEVIREIKFLRSMVEGQLAGFAWGEMQRRDPSKLELMRRMLTAGFSPALGRQVLDKMPAGYDFEKGARWLKAALAHNLRTLKTGEDIVDRGGIYACVGPTGVGKTTTVAKLAARCILKHGTGSLALLTTDSYRIGAHEQLRIYGKILGVPVYAVKDDADLRMTLSDLQDKHLILIDTVGMSQRDRRLAEQVALLSGAGQRVRRLLLLAANSQGHTLEDVVRAYLTAGVDGCLLTKVDEAVSMGGALDVVVRHKLLLHYVTNGQRVPEDLHLANSAYLIDRVLKGSQQESSFTPREDEYPLVMAAGYEAGGRQSGLGAYCG
jgi:flagellar biosynthesis protein FlhF